MVANNYPIEMHDENEVAIQTNPKQLEATDGKVYLTRRELIEMLALMPSTFRVVFTYDDTARKWDTTVEGASTSTEARQGFNAVVLTCQDLNPALLNHSIVTGLNNVYSITPAV